MIDDSSRFARSAHSLRAQSYVATKEVNSLFISRKRADVGARASRRVAPGFRERLTLAPCRRERRAGNFRRSPEHQSTE